MAKFVNDIVIEDARIFSKNFRGEEKMRDGMIVNGEGKMTFCVAIPDEVAQDLIEDNWDIRISRPREDSENQEPSYYMPVEVKFRDRTGKLLNERIYPKVFMYVGRPGRKETVLDEDSIATLDGADFVNIDLTLHPRRTISKKTGEEVLRAFLLEGYFTIKESRLRSKYSKYRDESDEIDEVPFD